MSMDMMIEAMKVAYSKSKSKNCGSSLESRPSPLHTNLSPSTLSQFHPLPALTKEAIKVDMSKSFTVNFIVKLYGTGTIRHYSDFSGSQVVMDKFVGRAHRFAANLRSFGRKTGKNSKCILVFTRQEMMMFGESKHITNEKIPLDQVYAVHPHPTKNRVFGVLADSLSSGTVQCYCFATTGNNTNTDVLCAFREACMHWLSNNLTKETQLKPSPEDGVGEQELDDEEIFQDKTRTGSIPADEENDVAAYTENIFNISEEHAATHKLKDSRSLDSGSSSELEGSLKKVSFAKHSLRYTANEVDPEKVTESDTASSIYFKHSGRDADRVKPLFPTLRRFTSPPPPRNISPTPILKAQQAPVSPDSTRLSIDIEESWSSSSDARYPLFPSEEETTPVKHDSPPFISPEISNASILSDRDHIKVASSVGLQSDCISTLESSIPASLSDYYTPFDSFHDSLIGNHSDVYKASLPRSSSAPSFMICAYSDGQVTHCLTDDSTIDDFKAYLLNISDLTGIPELQIQTFPEQNGDDNVGEESLVYTDSTSTFSSKKMGSSPKTFCKTITIEVTQTTSSESEIHSPEDCQREEIVIKDSPRCGYRDIALSELLDKIYPAVNTSHKSSEDSMSPSPKHESHFKFAGLVLSNNFPACVPSSSLPTSSPSMTTCSTEKTDHTITLPPPNIPLEKAMEEHCTVENSSSAESVAANAPSTLILHESDKEVDSQDDLSSNSSTSLCQTYSVHDSDENSMFTIPSLPLECISSSPQTTSVSAASTPASIAGTYGMEDTSSKETGDTSSDITSGGSNDENSDSFCPKQGSSSDYYSECLSQPNANLINDSADISMMTIPSLPLGSLGSRCSVDESNLNKTVGNSSGDTLSPLNKENESINDASRAAKDISDTAITSQSSNVTETNLDTADKVKMDSTDTVSSGLAPPVLHDQFSPRVALPVHGREKNITVFLPQNLFEEGTQLNAMKSEPVLKSESLSEESKKMSTLSVPPLAYTKDTSPYQSLNKNNGSSETGTSSGCLQNSSTDTYSCKETSEKEIPSLSLKITAWSSDRNSGTKDVHHVSSSPAKLGLDSEKNKSRERNAVAITVMEPPKLICEDTYNSVSSMESRNEYAEQSDLNASLKYVTELLESSHNSLAKAVQTLSQKALIKQSNISLELILPLKDFQRENKDRKGSSKVESHLAKLQLNSSTFYTNGESEILDKDENLVI